MATKAQLIQQAADLGIPAQRLTGTKAQVQAQVDSYSEAQAEASADTAEAVTAAPAVTTAQRGIHPVNALAFGAALGGALHFLG